ncbi:RNY1-A Ribonuclease T2-like 1-A [Candida maltosa Xu316]|uniref:ribonuclease T2 n=1 Tax=Candida maltosa (strain Xu316) TaxID=1245528 RepID=M3JZ20_CANMX|nr:hypothetical protein G210_1204 [Candida maltosa Xu316]
MLAQTTFLLAIASSAIASPYVNPYVGKFFHGQRYSGDSSSQGSIYPIKDCSAFIDQYGEQSWPGQNTTDIPEQDLCCFEPDGVFLQAQFWNFNTSLLSVAVNGTTQEILDAETKAKVDTNQHDLKRTFTIHGTWSDQLDGGYKQFCNPDLEISDEKDNITHILVDLFGEVELYDLMTKYWINTAAASNVDNSASTSLWEHEFNKHATCMQSFNPSCFTGNFSKYENVVNFYKKSIEIWSQLDTYQFLAQDGIYPTLTRKYKLSDVQASLQKAFGAQVYIGCLNNSISEIWYHHLLQGNAMTGTYKPIDTLANTTCKEEEVWYIPS